MDLDSDCVFVGLDMDLFALTSDFTGPGHRDRDVLLYYLSRCGFGGLHPLRLAWAVQRSLASSKLRSKCALGGGWIQYPDDRSLHCWAFWGGSCPPWVLEASCLFACQEKPASGERSALERAAVASETRLRYTNFFLWRLLVRPLPPPFFFLSHKSQAIARSSSSDVRGFGKRGL
ncbi:hypothetical protein BD311DRAFT_308307 [Dichomitus squalens]|uniref:Uncharacterized protein n=1 Tax=Dichomitus squalens TaxID=114155 RepID=A0A4Q9MR52_9APHY|nr:hypothetical protein BD311DRAFT_308307 [Dichomitus squalens]